MGCGFDFDAMVVAGASLVDMVLMRRAERLCGCEESMLPIHV